MKACPYCGQQIQDEAIKCRFCGRDLPAWAPPAVADEVPETVPEGRVGQGALRFSHSGVRYLLGYGADFFGIWDRQTPGGPVRRHPRTDEGWRQAWAEYSSMEPHPATVEPTVPAVSAWEAPAPSGPQGAERRPVSPFLWILPLLGWLGGLAAWAIVRDRDPRMARNMLLTGVVISVVALVFLAASRG